MKKLLLSIVSALFLCSCSNENESLEKQDVQQEEQQITSTLLVDYQIPEEDIYYLQKLGFAGSSVQVFEKLDQSSNETYICYLLEGDIEFKASELTYYLPEEALEKGSGLTSQYRTTNIAIGRTYKVIYNGTNAQISQAVNLAIDNYNSLNLTIGFQRVNSAGHQPSLVYITISEVNLGDPGGVAGFPRVPGNKYQRRNGLQPYPSISLDPSTANLGLDVLEHVITHELGHCIGLRHTDWFDRQCISTPGNEGQTQYGAIHIPGTPTTVNIDANSIMMACFNSNSINTITFGEFTNHDITALQALW